MCGIFGIFNLRHGRPFDEDGFAASLQTIRHRGPDAQKVRRFGQQAMLGHVRLSIIDLSHESDQPFSVGDRYHVVFNGEIFNFVELRTELEAEGVRFRTRSDTEVLLQAYVRWGESCVTRFNGMWAFAILDEVQGTLFCSRDRFGEKPLCWVERDGQFLFASEAKALLAYDPGLAIPDLESIANFCRTSVGAQHRETWFREIRRLAPGHNLIIRGGRIRIDRYWHYPSLSSVSLSEGEAVEVYRQVFDDAVRLRLRSDVPLGVTLSAGIDSSSIASTMQSLDPRPHHCFTAAFDPKAYENSEFAPYSSKIDRIDEASVADRLARQLGLTPHRIDADYSDLVGSLALVIRHLESGNSSPAVLPLMQVMGHASKTVKVVLEGQGADELLAGYVVSTIWPSIIGDLAAGRVGEAMASLRGFVEGHSVPYSLKIAVRNLSNSLPFLSLSYQRMTGVDQVLGRPLRGHARRRDYPSLPGEGFVDPVSRMLRQQHSGGLVNLLHYGDAVSMAHGIESRNPFLDHRLVEFVWKLPASLKIRRGVGKYIHRQAMAGRVPGYILDSKFKFGFTTPIARQFRQVLSSGKATPEGPVDVLLSDRCLGRGIFNPDAVVRLLQAHREGGHDHGNVLFRLLSVELWHREFIDSATGWAIR
jgi:asparagine synthase (glutamine-hydrolysing)